MSELISLMLRGYIIYYAFTFLLYIGLPFFFGYVGGRFKRHSIGLPFAFSPLILMFAIISVILQVRYGLSIIVFLGGWVEFGIVYFIVALVGYIIGFRWKTIRLLWKPRPTEDELSHKKREGAGDISTV